MKLRFALIAALILSLRCASASAPETAERAAHQTRPRVPRLPEFQLKDLQGTARSLDDLKGSKATLLNFMFPT